MVDIKMAWYWYEVKFYIRELARRSWYEFHMWDEWGLVTEVGMKFICMMSIPLLFDYDWSVVSA